VTLPTVTTPTVTTPSVPQPPQAPPPPTVPGVTLPSLPSHPSLPGTGGSESRNGGGGTGGGSSGGGAAAGGTGGAQSSGMSVESPRAGASLARVHHLHLARDWIAVSGPKRERRTTLVFVLHGRTVVELVVVQVAPHCRRIGRFRVRGHRGVNRVPLGGRIGRHSLSPGTYRIVARTLPGGRKVVDTRLVVVRSASRDEIRAARGANACARADVSGSGSSSGALDPTGGGPPGAAGPAKRTAQPVRHRGVLGAKFARRALSAVDRVPLWLQVLSGLAVALLVAAALFPKARPGGLSASLAFGLTGAAVLLLVTIAYALL
jgi:hypothetical protein